ncbi:MAG: hypothetical protein U5K37_08790 [Natrialbaceae archaeon]|nr:hypothetical protein [Natrialbaceae archaeon]
MGQETSAGLEGGADFEHAGDLVIVLGAYLDSPGGPRRTILRASRP